MPGWRWWWESALASRPKQQQQQQRFQQLHEQLLWYTGYTIDDDDESSGDDHHHHAMNEEVPLDAPEEEVDDHQATLLFSSSSSSVSFSVSSARRPLPRDHPLPPRARARAPRRREEEESPGGGTPAAAWAVLSATRTPVQEGHVGSRAVVAGRDAASIAALTRAQTVEHTVTGILEQLGQIVLDQILLLIIIIMGRHEPNDDEQQHHDEEEEEENPDEEIWAYFSKHDLLALWVDLALETPHRPRQRQRRRRGHYNNNNNKCPEEDNCLPPPRSCGYPGVAWSPRVKAQILQTLAAWVTAAAHHDPDILAFLLSSSQQALTHQLLANMLPLHQWTDPALDRLIPPWLDLLQSLTHVLASSPHLFPLFTVSSDPTGVSAAPGRSSHQHQLESGSAAEKTGVTTSSPSSSHHPPRLGFTLFTAILETATSHYAQSNSRLQATCFHLLMILMRQDDPAISSWMAEAVHEHQQLAQHLCTLLLRRYQKLIHLTTGPVVDAVRSKALAQQAASLQQEQWPIMNEFWSCCDWPSWPVRLCECFLQQVVAQWWQDLVPTPDRRLLCVGRPEADVIPEREARAQVATWIWAQAFAGLTYAPLRRMLAVAGLAPRAPVHLWESLRRPSAPGSLDPTHTPPFLMTWALHQVASQADDPMMTTTTLDLVENPYRAEFIRALQGRYGEWRVVTAALVWEKALQVLDLDTLTTVGLLPSSSSSTSPGWEGALVAFLQREHSRPSAVTSMALECVASLILTYLPKLVQVEAMRIANPPPTTGGDDHEAARLRAAMTNSPVWKALLEIRDYFYGCTLASQHALGVADIFVDLIESVVQSRYSKRLSTPPPVVVVTGGSGTIRPSTTTHPTMAYALSLRGSATHGASPECLIRKMKEVQSNDVECTRYYAQFALHFRAVVRVLERYGQGLVASSKRYDPSRPLDLVDPADELALIFGCLRPKPGPGSDLDLRGRMVFRFFSSWDDSFSRPTGEYSMKDPTKKKKSRRSFSHVESRLRTWSDDIIVRPECRLALVLDPTDLFVVKPLSRQDGHRGTILCGIPLLQVIAAAGDGPSLHVAVRHDDVGFLIKNGNMALRFDNPGTCLIVCQYLDRCRRILRQELLEKIQDLFTVSKDDDDDDEVVADAPGELDNDKDEKKEDPLPPYSELEVANKMHIS